MGDRPLRIAFALQGEGRGHMTQALALAHHLRAAGHSVTSVWVGLGPGWKIPSFFADGIGAPVTTFRGPTHTLNAARTRVSPGRTGLDALLGLPAFLSAALRRRREITPDNTDVVVSFYDAVGGISRFIGRTVPSVAIGHHYILFHDQAPRLPLSGAETMGLRLLTRITAHRADEVLALSFADLEAARPSAEKIGADHDGVTGKEAPATSPASDQPTVVPPLLRAELSRIEPTDQGHLLAYAVAPGIGNRIVDWQRTRPDVRVHLYLAGGAAALSQTPGEGCQVHDLDADAFLGHMGSCRAFAGSAGFESLCEAFYLGKPTLAVPTPGQIEQQLNAADGRRAGVIRVGDWDDLDDFWNNATPPAEEAVTAFRNWVDSGPARIVARVEEAARG